jgi:hypothetical protein
VERSQSEVRVGVALTITFTPRSLIDAGAVNAAKPSVFRGKPLLFKEGALASASVQRTV